MPLPTSFSCSNTKTASPSRSFWVGGILVSTLLALALVLPPKSQSLQVAMIGNSIQFVNDSPRFLEAISGGQIQQQSCLHGSLSLRTILRKGNGMYYKWSTSNAYIPDEETYDFGACTVTQLLYGYDEHLSIANQNDYYVDDGSNPCFQSESYLQYSQQRHPQTPPRWDFVILNDQTKYPVIASKRNSSARALVRDYIPRLLDTEAIPVLLVTHGYVSSETNMTGLGDVPTFTRHLYRGYQHYAHVLQQHLPLRQTPKLALSGIAFLVVWEEQYSLWLQLFAPDGYHPSPLGTYLMGCVIYMTLTGTTPPAAALDGTEDGEELSYLWERARRMHIGELSEPLPFPTLGEARYLHHVAERVVLKGYRPLSLEGDWQRS